MAAVHLNEGEVSPPMANGPDRPSSETFQNLDKTNTKTTRPDNDNSLNQNHDPVQTPPSTSPTQTTESTPPPPEQQQQQHVEVVAPEDQRTKLQTALIVAALCSGVFLAALDVTITTVAIPTISGDFHSDAGYTWIGSAYLLANAAAAPSWGKMSDIFGRKPVLLTAVGIFWIGSLLCGASVNMPMLLVGRAVQGIGGGGTLILVNICISDMFSVRKRGVYLGFVGLTWAVAGGFGPVLGGVFTTKASWRWCFYINLPISGLAFAILYFTVKLHNPKTPFKQGLAAVDWLGSLTIIGGTLMFLLGLELGGSNYKWESAQFICLLVFGLVVIGIFIVIEMKFAKFPVVPVLLFKAPRNLIILVINACHGFVFISASYYLPLYFQGVLGANALLSGVYVLPFSFTLGVASAVTGFLIKKTGKYLPPIIGGFTLMTIGYGLFIDLGANPSWAKIICFQIILGLGVGPNFQSPLIALQNTVQPKDIASATGTFMFIRQLATSISIVVGGVIFSSGMAKQFDTLQAELGQETADLLGGNDAAASVSAVQALPEPQRGIAQEAYWTALRTMYIFYVVFAGLGLVLSFFIGGGALNKKHTEHKTGLNTLDTTKKQVLDEEKDAGAQGGVTDGDTIQEEEKSNEKTEAKE